MSRSFSGFAESASLRRSGPEPGGTLPKPGKEPGVRNRFLAIERKTDGEGRKAVYVLTGLALLGDGRDPARCDGRCPACGGVERGHSTFSRQLNGGSQAEQVEFRENADLTTADAPVAKVAEGGAKE